MLDRIVWATVLAYNLTRWFMLNAALKAEIDVKQVIFLATLRAIQNNVYSILTAESQEKLEEVIAAIINQIAQKKVYLRPGRKEPRVVKRRRKPHELMKKKRTLLDRKLAA